MISTTRRVNDSGFKNMLRNTAKTTGTEVQVGIFSDSYAARSSVAGSPANQLAYRYAIHDEGRGNNPQRSTLDPAIQQGLRRDKVVAEFLALDLDKSNQTYTRRAVRAGLRLVAAVKEAIVRIKQPAKKQSTINAATRRYGGRRANPLIQTAEMLNAVDSRYKR